MFGRATITFAIGPHFYFLIVTTALSWAHQLINLAFIMAALCNRGAIIFLPCSFFLLSIFFISSPNLSGHRLDVYHTSTHGVALMRI